MGPGWGVAPIYAGQQHPRIGGPDVSHIRNAEQGRLDALDAALLADRAGFSSGPETGLAGPTRIYLRIEVRRTLPREDLTYVNAWCATVRSAATPYLPGVYCWSRDTAAQLLRSNPDLVLLTEPGTFRRPDRCAPGWNLEVSGAPDPSHPDRGFDPNTGAWLD
jgi:hypothetical protein